MIPHSYSNDFSGIIFKEIKSIFAAVTTIKQSNLYPSRVIYKLQSTSTVQAASESKSEAIHRNKRGDYMK